MAVRIGINGFGRIGRCVVRAWQKDAARDGYEIVADQRHHRPHDPGPPAEARLGPRPLRRQRRASRGRHIVVDGQLRCSVTAEKDPAKLPWKQHGVDDRP